MRRSDMGSGLGGGARRWMRQPDEVVDRHQAVWQRQRAVGVTGAAGIDWNGDVSPFSLLAREAEAMQRRGNTFGDRAATPYLVRRLTREHPDIAEHLARGEFGSVRAARWLAGLSAGA